MTQVGSSGPLDPSVLQQLHRVADTNNDRQLSVAEIKSIAGEDLELSEAEAETHGLSESRSQINQALQAARSMSPNEIIFGAPSHEAAPTETEGSGETPESSETAETSGLDDTPAPEIPDDPSVRTIGRDTRNFMEYLRPLDSSGDHVQLQIAGEAEVGFGWFGVEASGAASVNIVREGDDYLVNLGVTGQAGATAGKGVEVGVHAGASAGMTYRFSSMEEANNFLKHQMRENIPHADYFLPHLDDGPDMSHIRPFNTDTSTHVGASVSGSLKVGNFKVGGGASLNHQNVTRSFAGGRESNDTYTTGTIQASIQRGNFRAGLSGSYTHAHVEYHPNPNLMGEFNVFNGTVSLSFSPGEQRDIANGNTDVIRDRLTDIGQNLNLSGGTLNRFVGSSLTQIHRSVASAEPGIDITVGLTAQAKWRTGDTASGEDELVFFRLGTTASVTASAGFDIGVAEGKISASASMTDYTDM